MIKDLRNRLDNSNGFSLVELIVVIAIMVILIALLVPNVVGYISKAQDSANLATAKNVYEAVNTAVIDYKAQNGAYPTASELGKLLQKNAKDSTTSLISIPKGTGVAVGYDGEGYVWAVAVGGEKTATNAVTKDSTNIQIYSPTVSGNVYMSGTADSAHLGSNQIPKDVRCFADGSNYWYGASSSAEVPELFK